MLWWRGHRSQVHKYPFSSIFPASPCRDGCKYSLIQNRTGDFGASFALLRRKALQPFPQTFATFASNVCNLCLKRLHPLPQTFASTCKRPRKALPLSPQAFASSGIRDTPHLISFIPYPRADMPPLLCSYDSKIFLLCIRIFLWLCSFLQDAPFLPIIYNARFVKKI